MLPPKCFCRRRIICAVKAISGRRYKTCLPCKKYSSISLMYSCVLPLLVTPCNKQTFFSIKLFLTSAKAVVCASLNSKSILIFFGKLLTLSMLRFSTNKMFLSVKPFNCATVAPDFFSKAVCVTSPSVLFTCKKASSNSICFGAPFQSFNKGASASSLENCGLSIT